MVGLPTWDQFMIPMLNLLADGRQRRLREMVSSLADEVLTPDQLAERLPSGNAKADNRIGWAASYLSRVGAIDRPSRGEYVIAELGRQILASHPKGLSERDLRSFAREGDEWWGGQSLTTERPTLVDVPQFVSIDPVEQVETGIARIESEVAAELLHRLHAQVPAFFEQAVLDLLVAMGYGGAEGKATRTQLSNDGGVDGIIDQDALGLSRVYVQAKRYAAESAVGRPDIQGFVGALHGAQANQGVFITTGRFSAGAREYADSVGTRVVLIDGARLTALMIRFGVGVQVKRTVHLVEVDEDFFE